MYTKLQKNLTTTSSNEDLVTTLKALSICNGTTIPFCIAKIKFHATTDTDVQINNSGEWLDLRQDLVDGLYKIEINDQKINSFIVKDTGIVYYVEISY